MTGNIKSYALLCLAGFALLGLVGCDLSTNEKELAPKLGYVESLADKEVATNWFYDWANHSDIADDKIKDILFIFSMKGRDWRMPSGPDGYLIRLLLIGPDDKPTYREGTIRALLVQNPDKDTAKAVCAWQIDPQESQWRFDHSHWPGYVLPLDWGEGPTSSSGLFMLVVRWQSADGKATFTRNTVFEDAIVHRSSKSSRPVGMVTPASPGSAAAPGGDTSAR